MGRVWSSSLVDRFNPEPKIPYEGVGQDTISVEVDKRMMLEDYLQKKAFKRAFKGVRMS